MILLSGKVGYCQLFQPPVLTDWGLSFYVIADRYPCDGCSGYQNGVEQASILDGYTIGIQNHMQYKHTQNGKLIKWVMSSFIALIFIIVGMNVWNSQAMAYSLLGVVPVVVLTWLFGSLTVEIDGEELRHYFGPGFWRKTYLLSDIETAMQVQNSWLFGWGIRLTPHGWLYNVSGLDAVEIQLRSGKKFRVGTDQSSELTSVLQGVIKTN